MKRIGLLAGSLRAESYARKAARNLGLMAPNTVMVEPLSITGLPLMGDHLSTAEQATCQAFKDRVQQMDAYCLVTPEINRGIPGCLKNALDIASVSYQGSLWEHKPALIVSVSTGKLGGMSASQQLKQLALVLGMQLVQPTEIYVSEVRELFAKHDLLTNPSVLTFLQAAMTRLVTAVQADQPNQSDSTALTFTFTPDKLLLCRQKQQVGQATFEWSTGLLVITGITVEPEFERQGLAGQLMIKLLIMARLFHLSVMPECPYAQAFLKRYPELQQALCLH